MAGSIRDATEWQQRVNSDVSQLFERLDTIGTTQLDMIERSTFAANRFMESLGEIGAIHEKLVEASGSIQSATGDVSSLAAELRGQVEVFSRSNEQIREQLAAQVDTMSNQVQVLTSFWDDFRDQLQGLSDNLERSVTEFSGLAADKLGEVFHRVDSEMATIVQHLSGTLAEIREVTDELPPSVEQLKKSVEQAAGPMEDAGTQFAQLAASLTELRELGPAVGAAANELSENRQAIRALNEAVSRLRTRPQSSAQPQPESTPGETDPGADRPTNGESRFDIATGSEPPSSGRPGSASTPPEITITPPEVALPPDIGGSPQGHRRLPDPAGGPDDGDLPPVDPTGLHEDATEPSKSPDPGPQPQKQKPWWRTWREGR